MENWNCVNVYGGKARPQGQRPEGLCGGFWLFEKTFGRFT